MPDNNLFEAVANLILQSISVWEDMHLYANSYSVEYYEFWGLLDDSLKCNISKRRGRNREERLVPFTMSFTGYYINILTRESYARISEQHWKKQLKTILTDEKFRVVMTELNHKLRENHQEDYRYYERRAAVNAGSLWTI
jgi:hypothetical protein